MNTTANRLTGKKDGDTVDAADSFVNEKVSASCAHGRSSTQSTVDDPGREESGSDRASTSLLHAFDDIIIGNTDIPKFLVDHKSTLRFPETLLLLLVQAERKASKNGFPAEPCIAWASKGDAIIIRDREVFVNKLLPEFFCKSRFSSFTRKLYRWGFRQVIHKSNSKATSKTRVMIFSHPLFQRDNKPLMLNMKSVTAEASKREFASHDVTNHQGIKLSTPLMVDRPPTSNAPSPRKDERHPNNSDVTPLRQLLEENMMTNTLQRDYFAAVMAQRVASPSFFPTHNMFAARGDNLTNIASLLGPSMQTMGGDQIMLMHLMSSRADGFTELAQLQAIQRVAERNQSEDLVWPTPQQVVNYNRALASSWHRG